MPCEFDTLIDRRCTESVKWGRYGEDVLPMWVADMDFRSPEPVVRAICERAAHGVFGYPNEPDDLREVFVQRLQRLYGWQVHPGHLLFIPGVVTGLNMACHGLASPGEGALIQTPVYPPFLTAPGHAGLEAHTMPLDLGADGHYSVDLDRMAETIRPNTRLFLLCNPHNPVGRVFRRHELLAMADLCLRGRRGSEPIVICSDEVHGDLVYAGHPHLPIASLDPEIARHTVTLMAPSKTFNIAGLGCSVAIVQDDTLRERLRAGKRGLVPGVSAMGLVAALAAYRDGQPWLDELLCYLEGNRDLLVRRANQELPGLKVVPPEGTYLAWIDCRALDLPHGPFQFFLKQARVALGDGAGFGPGGEGFVRLNYGCCRSMLEDALDRMRAALTALEPQGGALQGATQAPGR
jgi:cysteine-S-conjugate beta-lyase